MGRIRGQLERFVEFDESPTGAVIANNLDWTGPQTVLEFLRDVGKHFSVNVMLARETVKRRLAAEGMSYTEFSYLLLQSQDYLHLYRREGCRLQIGGSDQWGNIVGGVELIRRVEGATVHALTVPLVTDSEGRKFGKSTGGGNIWLDPQMTSPYAWYQYFVNVADADVGRYLRMFTFLSLEEIEQLEKEVAERPQLRAGAASPRRGADHARARRAPDGSGRRGQPGAVRARRPARARRRDARRGARRGAAATVRSPTDRRSSTCWSPPAWPTAAGRRAATVSEGGAYVNNVKVTDEQWMPAERRPAARRWLVVRRGKRNLAGVRVERERAEPRRG